MVLEGGIIQIKSHQMVHFRRQTQGFTILSKMKLVSLSFSKLFSNLIPRYYTALQNAIDFLQHYRYF